MYRSLFCKSGGTLRRASSIINGESSSSSSLSAKYFVFNFQNQKVFVISKSRVSSTFSSFSTASDNSNSSSSFSVSYLINSCGLSQKEAITASRNLNFKTTSNPDSVLTLLRTHGFTDSHISKLVNKHPRILSFNPDKILGPKIDFFKSKGFYGPDFANFFSIDPTILLCCSLNKMIIPSFDILKSVVQSDQDVIKLIKRNSRILGSNQVKRVMLNTELLRNQGVPETKIFNYLIQYPRAYVQDADRFKEIVEKVKEMGFDHLQTTFLKAIVVLISITDAIWENKKDAYKRWGWSEDQIQSAFRRNPHCMATSEKKIMAVMNFLVNEMGYDSVSISGTPIVFNCSLKDRIIPRCSVIRILVSKGLIQEKICINPLSRMVDEAFLEKFVKSYQQEVPELMKVFQGQLNYQDLLMDSMR